ncbi:unnamed protein product [Plutella xylostella]|uniref:(diamondback moth) hypothetical protein n=1 Tax=Plutella xylostella TaxID=51655 RepID=A0A8S4G7G6_PLUXY|nr:unnamed protein product [Plutella xylostella]
MNAESLEKLIDEKINSLQSFIIKTMHTTILGEFKKTIETMSTEFTQATDFLAAELKDVLIKLKTATKTIENLKNENSVLSIKVADLTNRVASVEQHARECNVEIDCVPENRNENIVEVVKKIAHTVSYDLANDDIRSCFRISKMNKQSDRPRSIIAKLPSSRCRDELLAAVKVFNKSAPHSDKLSTSHLGIQGDKRFIFVSEHLSPVNKSLHAATRRIVKERGLKHCWVRNGQILVRKTDFSPIIIIKNLEMLNNL